MRIKLLLAIQLIIALLFTFGPGTGIPDWDKLCLVVGWLGFGFSVGRTARKS